MSIEEDRTGSTQNVQDVLLSQIGGRTNANKGVQLCIDRRPSVEQTMLIHHFCKNQLSRADRHLHPLVLHSQPESLEPRSAECPTPPRRSASSSDPVPGHSPLPLFPNRRHLPDRSFRFATRARSSEQKTSGSSRIVLATILLR